MAVAGLGLVTAIFLSVGEWFILSFTLMFLVGLSLVAYGTINQSRLDP